MTTLRIAVPTRITALQDPSALIIAANGAQLPASVGMLLEPGMQLQVAKPEQVTLQAQPAELLNVNDASTQAQLDAIQQAILQGNDPTAQFEATAAGAAAAGGGVVGSSAGSAVIVERIGDATLAEAGFDTTHDGGNAAPPQRVAAVDIDAFAAITVDEPQTADNIINASELTALIIRGSVDDVEVGQPVSVTLTDSSGQSVTLTTTVLPGNVWAADFGDLTGRLVDGQITITATTVDGAGNRAVDSASTLLDTVTTISLDLADSSDSGASQTDNLTRDTTPLLQGRGEPGASVTLSLAGQVLAVLTVDSDGNWQFTLPAGLPDGQHDFQVEAVDIAGNRATQTLSITVDTQASVDLDDLDTSALFGQTNATLSGTSSQVESGQTVTIDLIGKSGVLLTTTALVQEDGRWQVTGLDLSSLNEAFEVRASVTDLAGNSATDGAPLIGQSETLTLFESALAQGVVVATGTLNTGAGVDGNLQVVFGADQTSLEQLGLQSHGERLSYSLSSDNHVLTATAGGQTVFTLTLSDDGSYRIEWAQSLDHRSDTLALPFALEYRDNDGDLVKANLSLQWVDSTPVAFTVPATALTEDAFGHSDDVVSASRFVISHNADPILASSVMFSQQSDTLARLNGLGLSSDGHQLTFEFDGERQLIGFYQDAQGKRVTVLSATLIGSANGLDVDGEMSVHLSAPLDHQRSDVISLNLQVEARDIDGDKTQAAVVITLRDGADPVIGSDPGIALTEGPSQTVDGQVAVTVGSDRLVSLHFEGAQPSLTGLTSQGKATSYEVHDNQLTVKDWQGKTLMTVTIGLDGKYSVALSGAFDQPAAPHLLDLGLQVVGRDADGDHSNVGTLNISIADGALPQVEAVSLPLVEDSNWQQSQTLNGDLVIKAGSDPLASITFDANQPGLQGFTSGKQAVTIAVADHRIEGRTSDGTLVFELTLGNDGKYSFTLHQALDQGSADSLLKAGFTLLDSDGDKVSSTITVAVGDGANPTISAVTGTTITEMAQGEVATVSTMSFTVTHGSDALDPASLGFDIATIQSTLTGLTSHDNPVTFSLDANGQLVGIAGGQVVLRAELNPVDNNGNWSVTAKVTLSGELDHKGSESLNLPLAVTLADKDGDRIGTSLPLIISDGKAPSFIPGIGVTLDEGDLTGSNSLSQTGHFDVQAGSDRVAEVAFADASEQPALTALGKPVQYELVDGNSAIPGSQLLKGYVMVDGQRVEVFEVKLIGSVDQAGKNGFDYQVTLYQGIHQDANAVTELPIKVIVNDYDKAGGNNDSTSGTLNIQIGEGEKPTLILTGVTLAEGRFDGANSATDDQQASGKITIKADSDPVTDVQLTLSGQVMDASGKSITHNGEVLTWKAAGTDGHTFQAVTSGGLVVMTVSIPTVPASIAAHTSAAIDYQVTVHTNLDHGANDKLNLALPFKVTDSDGSVTTGSTTAVITDADNPVITTIEGVTVKESDLNGGSGQHGGTSPSGSGEVAIGQVAIAAGSDRVASLQLDVARFNALNSLTSGGKAVTIGADSQPGVYLGKDSAGKLIFKLTLDVSGRYTFDLTGNLDHRVQGKDLLDIQLPLQARDSDGDLSTEVIGHVSVQDDVAVAVDASKTLNEGAKVTGDLLATASEGADDAVVKSVTINGSEHPVSARGNTTISVTDGTGQAIGNLVINAEGNYSFTAKSGIDHSNSTLVQQIGFHLVDGDGDTDDGVLTLTIRDEAGKLTVSSVTGQEDAGATDPGQGIPITMSLDVGDFDRGEHVEQLLFQAPVNAQGTFYFNGIALTTITQGGKTWYQVPPTAMVAVANTNDKFELTGVTFVPNHDYSSYNNGGNPLRFPVQLQVGVTEGSKPPVLTGNLDITVQGIADQPLWDGASTQHYTTSEDSSGITLNVKAALTDTDGSETLSYQIKWESGQGTLTLNGKVLTPEANGLYTVAGSDINKITVVPGKDYSGDIKLSVTPISTEKNPIAQGQGMAQGDKIELVINVNPVADDAKLTLRDIQGKEDTLLDLGSKIALAHLDDKLDGSEQMFVRISGLPDGATLLLGGVAVSQSAEGYYEVPYDRIGDLKLEPPKNSNVDFDLTITGVVKDTASLTDANGQTHTVVNEKETGSQTLHVDLVGVADQPHFDVSNSHWQDNGGQGYVTTVKEDSGAQLDFKLLSGEKTDTPADNSESLNMVLMGLPEGAKVLDSTGKALTLAYAGLDGSGQPTYQVNISSLGNLVIQPPHNSTSDLHLTARVVVTENDGHHQIVETPLLVKVEPQIDAKDYNNTSHGLEDDYTVLNWQPDLSADGNEHVTQLHFSGIESGYHLWIKEGSNITELTATGGALDISDTDLARLLHGAQLLVSAPKDSDKDTHIQSHVTVTQHDVDSNVVASKEITGSLQVDIQAVVESDTVLTLSHPVLVSAWDKPVLLAEAVKVTDMDPSSSEHIDYLVISGLPSGFVVIGGINDGNGSWTVPAANIGSYALQAPMGFARQTTFTVTAHVIDDGEDGDRSAAATRSVQVNALFVLPISGLGQAAEITFNAQPVNGHEDQLLALGSALKSQITIGSSHADNDEVSLVIKGLPAGVSVHGMVFDFVNNQYVIKTSPSLDGLEKLTVSLPANYAGSLPITVDVVNTDTDSGRSHLVSHDIRLDISPVVDVAGTNSHPTLEVAVTNNQEGQRASLNLAVKLADLTPSPDKGGAEQVEKITVTVDERYGYFIVGNDQHTTTLVVDNMSRLQSLPFVPTAYYSGQVPLHIKVEVVDSAWVNGHLVSDRGSWESDISIDITPVNNEATLTVVNASGLEDGAVSLAGMGAVLTDTDGSEQIVALQIKGVPDGFTLSAPAVNNGHGVWQLPVGTNFSTLSLIPPADFSGAVTLALSAFTLDKGLTLPLESSQSFTVTVNPVGDALFSNMLTSASGTEGEAISLTLNLETRDTRATGSAASQVHEYGPEQVRVTISDVPEGAEVRLPDGVSGTVTPLGNGQWQITTTGGELKSVLLVTHDVNGKFALSVTAQSLDNGALGPEVHGTITLDVAAVNDAPVNQVPQQTLLAEEDQPLVIHDLQVKDVDAGNGAIEVHLVVGHGTLNVGATSGVTVTGNGSGSVLLSGPLAAINALLASGVTYQGNPDFHGDDSLQMVTNDKGNSGSGGALSDTDVVAIDVQPVNDAPVNQVPGHMTVQEDSPYSLSAVRVSDVDADTLTVSLSVEHGVLVLAAASATVQVTQAADHPERMTLEGRADEINALLASAIHYQPTPDYWGSDQLTVHTSDMGQSGSGGVLTADSQIPITVRPEADMPHLDVASHGILALEGAHIPIGISLSLANPTPGELSLSLSGLNGAQVVDADGNTVGSAGSGGDWLLPVDHTLGLALEGVSAGDHALTLTATSAVDGTTQSTSQSLTLHVESGHSLVGSIDDDHLFGSDGDDILQGGKGNDVLQGGAGHDRFVWSAADQGSEAAPAHDTITDFKLGEDVLDISDLLQGSSGSGSDDLSRILHLSVSSAGNGLSKVELGISPAGDDKVTQSITLERVDLGPLSGSSHSEILQALIEQQDLQTHTTP